MRSTPRLISADALDGYMVRVRFEDGIAGDVDLSYLLEYGGVFEPLRDPLFSASFTVTPSWPPVAWPNDADIAPETLYAAAQQNPLATPTTAS